MGFDEQNFFNSHGVQVFFMLLVSLASHQRHRCQVQCRGAFILFSPKSVTGLGLTGRSLIHSESAFVHGFKKGPASFLRKWTENVLAFITERHRSAQMNRGRGQHTGQHLQTRQRASAGRKGPRYHSPLMEGHQKQTAQPKSRGNS